eukprot:COSAG02_NODE_64886_length_259_cov_0.781250_1_plen_82_part_10
MIRHCSTGVDASLGGLPSGYRTQDRGRGKDTVGAEMQQRCRHQIHVPVDAAASVPPATTFESVDVHSQHIWGAAKVHLAVVV